MQRIYWTILWAALLSGSLSLAGAGQDISSRLAGTVMDTTGVGLPATTVWVAPNSLTQGEIDQIDAAQKALELAKLRLEVEQTKLDLGASVVRFVIKEQHNVLQAEVQRTALEATALGKVFPANRTERTVMTDATGGFVLQGIAPGSYVVKAFRRGFEPSLLTFVEVKSGQDVRTDITIRRF